LSDFHQAQCCKRPQRAQLKVNSDGAFDPNTRSGGWGFTIRDEQGLMILAGSGKKPFLLDVFPCGTARLLGGSQIFGSLGAAQNYFGDRCFFS
jgi:hypothetical protein